jgi:hypothetical protein
MYPLILLVATTAVALYFTRRSLVKYLEGQQ